MSDHHGPIYVLGHSEQELQRLVRQGQFYREQTEDLLRAAGIGEGMRVLDFGCGVGDVALLASELVGPSGSVLGIDRSAEAIEIARLQAKGQNLANVSFTVGSTENLSSEPPFDASVGRLVLMYQPDPVLTLQEIVAHVKPGGIVAFQEMDVTSGVSSLPPSPLYEKCWWWGKETCRKAGIELQMGLRLREVFLRAGLPAPRMKLSARVESGWDSPAYEHMAEVMRVLLPMMERLGVATAREVEVETLAERLRHEVVSGGGVIVTPALIEAWVRKPQAL